MKLPTRQNVEKILSLFGASEGKIYLNGQVVHERDDTDTELPFRQESNFFYVTGVQEPNFHVVIDIATKKITLLAPNVDPNEVMWIGMPDSLDTLKQKYDIDEAEYVSNLNDILSVASAVYTFPISKTVALDSSRVRLCDVTAQKQLYIAFSEARAVKSDWEIDLIRTANKISSDAHIKLWENVRPGVNESELYALFVYESSLKGAFFQAYHSIVGVGMNAATLHYGKNNADMSNPSDVVLVDAGAEYNCYASDITRVFPVSGKFTAEAKTIYNIVLDMQKACLAICKPGTQWEDVHHTATQVACKGLLNIGLLKGSEEEILDKSVVAAFFPHGIGHMMGLDVHDVAGYPEGVERIDKPGIRNLRMRRTLQAGFVVTVEPGIYFCDFLIDPVLESEAGKYIDRDVLAKYRSVGGVRIEDDIVITNDGYDNLTTVPKEIDEIETLMAKSAAQH